MAPLVVRPGEEATVEVVLHGPMPACTLTIGTAATELPSVAKGEHRRFKLAGRHRGLQPVKVAAATAGETDARFDFIKRY